MLKTQSILEKMSRTCVESETQRSCQWFISALSKRPLKWALLSCVWSGQMMENVRSLTDQPLATTIVAPFSVPFLLFEN